MQCAKFVRIAAAAAATIWLVGCASTGNKDVTDNAEPEPAITDDVVVETMPVLDPAIQAVVDSGEVDASSDEIEKMLDRNSYHFGFDSAKLHDDDYMALNTQAVYLNSNEGLGKIVVIQGHTDERGTRTYNLALGERRANAVKSYLVAKGVDASRIEVISFGFEKPLNTNHDPEAWATNRRAMIFVN